MGKIKGWTNTRSRTSGQPTWVHNTELNTRGEPGTYVEILGSPGQGWTVLAWVHGKMAHEKGYRTKKKALKEAVDWMERHPNPKAELRSNGGSGL